MKQRRKRSKLRSTRSSSLSSSHHKNKKEEEEENCDVKREEEKKKKVDRVLANLSLVSTASLFTSNISFAWFLVLRCNRQAQKSFVQVLPAVTNDFLFPFLLLIKENLEEKERTYRPLVILLTHEDPLS